MFAWGMYDLANTIFSALFVTFFFPFYVKTFLGGTEFHIGLVFGLSMLLVAIVVPFVGAWSDAIGKRMPFIVVFTLACCALTWLVGQVSLLWALVAGFFANFSYHAALTTYNALLPKVASKAEQGRVSGIGIGMGYVGTLLSLGVGALLLSRLGWESAEGARAIFTATAIMFVGLSLFTFFGVKEKRVVRKNHYLQKAFGAVMKTLRNVTRHKPVFLFFLAMFCFANAINAVIVFLFLYARAEIGLSVQAFFAVYAIQSVGAVVGSVVSGRITDRVGPKKVLIGAGVGWLAVLALLLMVQEVVLFTVAGVLGGAMLGTVWTAQRPKLLRMVQHSKAGQFFGFLELTNKFSGVFGPIVFGALASFWNYQAALISLMAFFGLGLVFLQRIPGDVL